MNSGSENRGAEKIGKEGMLEQSIKRVLRFQCIVSVLLLLGIFAFYALVFLFSATEIVSESKPGDFAALTAKLKASIYGSMLAITGTILSARSVNRSSQATSDLGHLAMAPIYSGLLNKLVIVGGGIALGLIVLSLEPIFVVIGYFVVQMAAASRLVMNEH